MSHIAMTPVSLPLSGLQNHTGQLHLTNPTQLLNQPQAVQVSQIPTPNTISNTGTLTRIESIKQTTLKKWGTKRNDLIYQFNVQ